MDDLIDEIMDLFAYVLKENIVDDTDLKLRRKYYRNRLIDLFEENDKIA